MSTRRRGMTLVMVLCLALTGVGCAPKTPAYRIAKAQERMGKMNSGTIEMNVTTQLSVADQTLTNNVTSQIQFIKKPLQIKMQIQGQLAQQDGGVIYARQEQDQVKVYGEQNGQWSTFTFSMDQLNQQVGGYDSMEKSINAILNASGNLTEQGQEQIAGVDVVKLSGEVSGDQMEQILAQTGNESLLGGLHTGQGQQMTGAMPITVYLDKTNHQPVRIQADLTQILISQTDWDVQDAQIAKTALESFVITFHLTDYNTLTASEIEVPPEALELT